MRLSWSSNSLRLLTRNSNALIRIVVWCSDGLQYSSRSQTPERGSPEQRNELRTFAELDARRDWRSLLRAAMSQATQKLLAGLPAGNFYSVEAALADTLVRPACFATAASSHASHLAQQKVPCTASLDIANAGHIEGTTEKHVSGLHGCYRPTADTEPRSNLAEEGRQT